MTDISSNLASNLATTKDAKVVRSFCYSCPWTCPTEVYVKDDKVVYVKGNQDSPNSAGRRRGKGMASSYVITDPDRLKYPMRRTGPKGGGQFNRISWEEVCPTDAIRSGNIADLVRFDRPGKTRRINVDTLKGQPSLVMDADN